MTRSFVWRAVQRVRFAVRRRALGAFAAIAAPRARARVARHNEFFYAELGIDRAAAEVVYREANERSGRRAASGESIHFLAFAALKAAGFRPSQVLELGTASGETTAYLAALFEEATVHTFELPDDDPVLQRFHGGGIDRATLDARLSRSNIVSYRLNTAFLSRQELPDFDLVWLDAGHEYPEVAWDHAYCLGKLRPGGWLLSDDIRPPDNLLFRSRPGALDAYDVTAYFNAREDCRFRYLLKRDDPYLYTLDRKYVAVLHKSAA